MKNINKQRKASLAILSFAMVLAVYLNWQYSRAGDDNYFVTATDTQQTNADYGLSESDMLMSSNDYAEKNYGDAQLVATTQSESQKYFDQARLARQKSRDEALDSLQKTLKNSKLTDEEKKSATSSLSEIIRNMTTETDIENMIKAKGFQDCIASMSDEKITVAVKGTGKDLTKADISKVRDVILSKTTISSQNIVVVEVK